MYFKISSAFEFTALPILPAWPRGCMTVPHTHPKWKSLFNKLKQQLAAIASNMHYTPSILTAFWLGLLGIRNDTSYPNIQAELPPILHSTRWEQSRLSWDQLYQGWVTHSWAMAIGQLNPHLAISGCQIITQMTQMVWTYMLATQNIQNQYLHHDVGQLSLPNYQQAVTTLYKLISQLPPVAQEAIFCKPLQQMLETTFCCTAYMVQPPKYSTTTESY